MDYKQWHNEASKACHLCGEQFLEALFEGTEQNNQHFGNLFDLLEMEVEGYSLDQKRKALFFIIMAESFDIQQQQEKLVQSLIKK